MLTNVEGLPFEKRLDPDRCCKRVLEVRSVDFTFVQQEVEKLLLGFGKRKQKGEASPGLFQQLRPYSASLACPAGRRSLSVGASNPASSDSS